MRRMLISLIAATLLISPLQAEELSLQQVVDRHIEASGGREALSALNTVRLSGIQTFNAGAFESPFTISFKRPNKMRLSFVVQGIEAVQAYDGTTGWRLMPFMGKTDPEPVTGDELKELEDQADLEGPLVDWEKKGHQVTLLGLEDIEGTPAYKLKLVQKNGIESTIFLEAESFLSIRADSSRNINGQTVEFTTILGDYKEVAGVMLPHSIESKPVGAPAGAQINIDKAEPNVELDDALFTMPKPTAPTEG